MPNQQHTEDKDDTARLIELPELGGTPPGKHRPLGGNLEVIRNVKVKLAVSLGETTLSVGELLDMKEGATLALDRLTEEPVDIVLDGHTVARGQLVAVGDYFGVRIIEQPKLDLP